MTPGPNDFAPPPPPPPPPSGPGGLKKWATVQGAGAEQHSAHHTQKPSGPLTSADFASAFAKGLRHVGSSSSIASNSSSTTTVSIRSDTSDLSDEAIDRATKAGEAMRAKREAERASHEAEKEAERQKNYKPSTAKPISVKDQKALAGGIAEEAAKKAAQMAVRRASTSSKEAPAPTKPEKPPVPPKPEGLGVGGVQAAKKAIEQIKPGQHLTPEQAAAGLKPIPMPRKLTPEAKGLSPASRIR